MADPSPPVSKYDTPASGTSYVILRRSIGRLDLVSGQEDHQPFGAFGYGSVEPQVPPGYVVDPADSLDTFEPLVRRVEEPSRAVHHLREAGAVMALIAIAIVGAGLWSRSEATAEAQAAPVAIVEKAPQVLERKAADEAFIERVRADVAALGVVESGEAVVQPRDIPSPSPARKISSTAKVRRSHPSRVRSRSSAR